MNSFALLASLLALVHRCCGWGSFIDMAQPKSAESVGQHDTRKRPRHTDRYRMLAKYTDAGERPRHTGRFMGEVVAPGQTGRYELLALQNPLYETFVLPNGDKEQKESIELDVGMVLPLDLDEARSYPVMIFFGGGAQKRYNWEDWCARFIGVTRSRGLAHDWIVVSPMASKRNQLDVALLPFFEELRARFRVESDRFHIAGQSLGGGMAFRTAFTYPKQCASLIVHTGVAESNDRDVLAKLHHVPVFMYVGDKDPDFSERMKATAHAFSAAGHPSDRLDFVEFTGVGHLGILDVLTEKPRLEDFWRILDSVRSEGSAGAHSERATGSSEL